MRLETIDVAAMATTILAIILGITGKIDWWVVVLILLTRVHLRVRL